MSIPNGITVAGKSAPSDCPINVAYSRGQGLTYKTAVRGLSKEVWSFFWSRVGGSSSAEFIQSDGEASARASFTYQSPQTGQAEIPPQTLDVDFHETFQSIFNNPTFIGIAPDRIKAIQRTVNLASEPNTKEQDVVNKINEEQIGAAPHLSVEFDAFDLLRRGVVEYPVQVPILTWTRVVSSQYTAALGLATAGQVWNDARVSFYLGQNAQIILFALADIATGFPGLGTPAGFSIGWLHKCKLNAQSNGNWQMMEIFERGAFANSIFPKDNFASPT